MCDVIGGTTKRTVTEKNRYSTKASKQKRRTKYVYQQRKKIKTWKNILNQVNPLQEMHAALLH